MREDTSNQSGLSFVIILQSYIKYICEMLPETYVGREFMICESSSQEMIFNFRLIRQELGCIQVNARM